MNYSLDELVFDLSQEIILGCDRFDKRDIEMSINAMQVDREDLKRIVREKIVSDYIEDETWSEPFLTDSINYWVDKN